jgi:hypothetical protein
VTPHGEILLALSYAAFLLATAEGLAVLGRWTTPPAGPHPRAQPTWPRADVLRFHAVLGAALVVLAALVLAVVWLRHPDGYPAAPLAFGAAAVAASARRAVRRLRASRAAPDAGAPAGPVVTRRRG